MPTNLHPATDPFSTPHSFTSFLLPNHPTFSLSQSPYVGEPTLTTNTDPEQNLATSQTAPPASSTGTQGTALSSSPPSNQVHEAPIPIPTNSRHRKRFQCDFGGCSYSSSSRKDRDQHKEGKHLKQRRYSCSKCQKPFSTLSNCHRHIRSSCPGSFVVRAEKQSLLPSPARTYPPESSAPDTSGARSPFGQQSPVAVPSLPSPDQSQ
ncbi:hypothetical protein QBC44DRAFT_94814 [Cladorrhinum sp. PSN332]|nr:hypothetical protein QBC44DRAFT_94814 [Cladorrhinum sp. PSN332]